MSIIHRHVTQSAVRTVAPFNAQAHDGETHVAPSPLAANVKVFTGDGMYASTDPVALDEDGIQATIADFARSGRPAMAAIGVS
jgi:hypothetical protein